jgi:FHS family Na+ dependent glucose MFS transporter 1
MCLGLSTAVIRPTLPALADQTRTHWDMGWLFLAEAVGYTLGTVLGGRIFDRVRASGVGAGATGCRRSARSDPLLPWFWLCSGVVAARVLRMD